MNEGILQIRKTATSKQSIFKDFNQLGFSVKVELVVDARLESVTAAIKLLETLCEKVLILTDEDVRTSLLSKGIGLHFEFEHTNQAIGKARKDNVDYIFLSNESLHLLEDVLPLFLEEKESVTSTDTHFYFLGIEEEELAHFFEQEVNRIKKCHFSMDKKEMEWIVTYSLKEKDQEKARRLLERTKKQLREKWPLEYIGQTSLPKTVNRLLKEKDLTITAAESLTSGAFMSYLSSEPDTGQFFEGGMVTYSERVKNEVLGVDPKITEQYGVVSSECAEEMANQARATFSADMGISLTGAAGPSSLEGKEPGTVWIGLSRSGYSTITKEFHFPYNRNENRWMAVKSALNMVRQSLLEIETNG